MTQTSEIQVYASEIKNPQPLSIEDVRKNTKLVKQILREAMVDKVDFGLIPGCGDKPSLFKPGAEKLMLLFKLGAFPEVTDLSTPDAIRYLVKTKIVHLPSDTVLGIGVGDCSSDEDKYKWRATVCDEEFDSLPEERKRLKWKKGWNDKPAASVKQVRTNPADISNTVLKMAKKRSMIDAVISATAASDILTQDLEEDAIQENGNASSKSSVPMPKAKSTPQTTGDFRQIKSQYAGTCKACPVPIEKGDEIYYSKQAGTFHKECKEQPTPERDPGAEG